nr:MAG TPA: hypothetical protein [Caudoviricetes sp.]
MRIIDIYYRSRDSPQIEFLISNIFLKCRSQAA